MKGRAKRRGQLIPRTAAAAASFKSSVFVPEPELRRGPA